MNVLVLYGNYANQLIQMDDAAAVQAIDDNWAVDATSWGSNGIDSSIDVGLNLSPSNYEQSIIDFQNGVVGGVVDVPILPVPVLTSIDPVTAVIGDSIEELKAIGSDFSELSMIAMDGNYMVTMYVSPTQLACTVSPQETPNEPKTVPVKVLNPVFSSSTGMIVGFKESAPMDFTFTATE